MRANGTPLAHVGEHRLGESLVYDFARLVGSPFSYDVLGLSNIHTPGPAIFVANHHGSIGPLAIILSIPVRFYPWIITEMMDFQRAPQYLFDDFIRPVLHLHGKFGLAISTIITKISVRLFYAIGAVSIDRFGGLTTDGFRQSLRLLHEGKNLLIFPENSLLPIDAETKMRPFMPGFATLCSLFQAGWSAQLPVYPIAVDAASEAVSIGTPEFYHPQKNHHESINEFCQLLENRVRELYIGLKNVPDDILV
jgi:hypothetical protein